jgi:uncharacterized protein YceK
MRWADEEQKMKKLILAMIFIFAGCSTVGNVLPISGGTYMVTTSGHYKSWSEMKASCIKRANEFCAVQKKQMKVIDWETHGVRGWLPQETELTFKHRFSRTV